MELRQTPLQMGEREPSKLGIKDKSTFSPARDSFEEGVRRRRWLDAPRDSFRIRLPIKRRPKSSGATDSEQADAKAKDIRPFINPKSKFSKAVPKELADLLSDLDTLDVLGRRDSSEQSDDYSKASLKTLEDSP